MARFTALFLAILVLLQTFSRELVVLDYQVHKERITELFCVNKDKPALHCNGKCHLTKQLRKASSSDSKAPTASFAKVKYELVVPMLLRLVAPATGWPELLRFALDVSARPLLVLVRGVFHPPAFRF